MLHSSILFEMKKIIQSSPLLNVSPVENGNSEKQAENFSLNNENCEEHPGRNLAQNAIVLRSKEVYINQVSEEIESKITKKLSKEFSRVESRILVALFRLDENLLSPLIQGQSGTAPEIFRNAQSTNQGTNEDGSQSDPHPEARVSQSQTTQALGAEVAFNK